MFVILLILTVAQYRHYVRHSVSEMKAADEMRYQSYVFHQRETREFINRLCDAAHENYLLECMIAKDMLTPDVDDFVDEENKPLVGIKRLVDRGSRTKKIADLFDMRHGHESETPYSRSHYQCKKYKFDRREARRFKRQQINNYYQQLEWLAEH